MNWRLIVLLSACLTAAAWGQKAPAFVGVVQLSSEWATSSPSVHDVDGDGRLDLVIPSIKRGEETERKLAIHLRRDAGFSPNADFLLDLWPDVTAYAVGDFCADDGLEVALFTGSRVAVWRPKEVGAASFRDHFLAQFFFQVPDNGRIVAWNDAVADLDGDGLDDLVIIEPGGYRVALQRRDAEGTNWLAERCFSLPPRRIPKTEAETRDVARSRTSARFWERIPEFEKARTGASPRAPLVEVNNETAILYVTDFDGDGKKDVVARGPFEVFVWKNVATAAGGDPDLRFEAPVVADRSRATDIAYSTVFADLDDNNRVDSVMFASDRRADDPRTQVLIYLQSDQRNGAATPLYGEKGIPAQLLVLAGFTGGSHFVDVNGDGKKDLVIGSLRPDIIDTLRKKASDNTEVDCYVYLNQGGGFSKAPDLRRQLELEVRGLGALTKGYLVRFAGDYTKDGTAELVVRDKPERLQVYWTRKDKDGGISIYEKPLWEIPLDKNADLYEVAATAKESAGFLVVESGRVAVVRFAP